MGNEPYRIQYNTHTQRDTQHEKKICDSKTFQPTFFPFPNVIYNKCLKFIASNFSQPNRIQHDSIVVQFFLLLCFSSVSSSVCVCLCVSNLFRKACTTFIKYAWTFAWYTQKKKNQEKKNNVDPDVMTIRMWPGGKKPHTMMCQLIKKTKPKWKTILLSTQVVYVCCNYEPTHSKCFPLNSFCIFDMRS